MQSIFAKVVCRMVGLNLMMILVKGLFLKTFAVAALELSLSSYEDSLRANAAYTHLPWISEALTCSILEYCISVLSPDSK